MGENFYMTDEYVERHMYYYIPPNDLEAPGATAEDYVQGELEDWCDGALRFNGKDDYCVLRDVELKSDYTTRMRRRITTDAGERKTVYDELVYPGEKRRTVDMDVNSFLIEIYFKTEKGHTGGTLLSKLADDAGYTLNIGQQGDVTLTLRSDSTVCELACGTRVNDGDWHHAIAEVDRPSGLLRIYIDGKQAAEGGLSLPASASLSNRADFLVGKGPEDSYFTGAIDFLRVCRGTLADAGTTIDELYEWQFNGPFLHDFRGNVPVGKRDAGALELVD
jgi:hypothetical protein